MFMTNKILRCAIYIRVSTAEQAMHGKSLAAQTEYLTKYANEHGMTITGTFADEGKTARKNFKSRKAIKTLLEHVKHDEVDVILFWKMDRWFRSVSDFYKVQDILDKHNVKWIATAEPNMNMETREGRLNLNIMLSINQNETDTTSERIRFVNDSSVGHGKVISGAQPYGYKISTMDGMKKVVKDPDREAIVKDFFNYYLTHQSKRGSYLYLVDKYGPIITMPQVETICTNSMYSGRYRDNLNYCPAYITELQYMQMLEINERNIKVYASNIGTGEIYLFSGLMRCPICGRKLSANRTTKNSHTGKPLKKTLRYYRCQNWCYKKTCTYSKIANEATIEAYLLEHIEEAKDIYLSDEEVCIKNISAKESVEKKKPDRQKLTAEIERLNNMYQKGRLSEDRYDAEYMRLTVEIQALDELPKLLPRRSYKELEAILCSGWRDVYDKLSRENKRAFWRSLINEIYLNEDNSFVKTIVLI